MAIAVVAPLMSVAVELQVMVACMGVGQDEAAASNAIREKEFQGILGPILDDLQPTLPGIPLDVLTGDVSGHKAFSFSSWAQK